MNIVNPMETLPSEASISNPERSGSSTSSYSTRRRRLPPSPGTPTPLRRTSQQLRRNKLPMSKPRAASTSALAALKVDKFRPSLPGSFPPLTSLPAHQEEDARRSERGGSEPLRTPDHPTVKAPSPSHSAPVVTTRSTLKRHRRKLEAVSNEMADQLLAKEIRAITIVPSGEDAKSGTNYVLNMCQKNDPSESFVKVGETRYHGDTRRKKIRWSCGHVGYNVPIPGQVPSRYWKKIERLVLAELLPHRYAINCGCGQSHREYFKPPAHLAVEATQRWTQFCESQPWDSRGKLHPLWEARLSDLQASKKLEKATLQDRAMLWANFANAGSWPFWKYNAQLVGWSLVVKCQLWMLVVLSAVFSTKMGPNWFLLYLNLTWQFGILSLYTFKDVHFAWNYARKSAKGIASPIRHIVPVPKTPQSIHESDTEDEHFASDGGGESRVPGTAAQGGGRPGSSVLDPIDLSSDLEVDG